MALLNRTETAAPEAAAAAAAREISRRGQLVTRAAAQRRTHDDLRARVLLRLSETPVSDEATHDDIAQVVSELLAEVLVQTRTGLATQERAQLIDEILDDVLGLGPLEALVKDPSVTDIMVNGPDRIFVERDSKISRADVHFNSMAHLMRVIDRIVTGVGRRVDESQPMVDARLRDGSRVNVIIPPLALTGPTITIRKFSRDPLSVDDLVGLGTLTQDMVDFLGACVRARLNIVVSGGGSSGKTTMLNVLSSFIPDDERIVTIEDAAELQLRQRHVVPLESRPANIEGRGRVTIRDLVVNSLRMRPDRIVVGECRGAETLDMLQAMNTGHEGSLTTLHANTPVDAVSRLEVMILMAGNDLPSKAIREQIGSALHVFVHCERLRDGSRKVTRISEVLGFDGEHVLLQDLFVYEQTAFTEDRVHGRHFATGVVPQHMHLLEVSGQHVDRDMFAAIPKRGVVVARTPSLVPDEPEPVA